MKKIKILFIGDVVGKLGRFAVSHTLPLWKKEYSPNLVIANVENITHGHGMSVRHLEEMINAGVDVMTGGNHSFEGPRSLEALKNEKLRLVRPANAPGNPPGKGFITVNLTDETTVTIANLMGQYGMKQHFNSPFEKIDEMLARSDIQKSIVILDWHAEATSEKIAMGWYLNGKVSAVLGTHTHVPTRDERVLPKGTAYISDVGMTGPYDSIIGKQIEPNIKKMITQIPEPVDTEESGPAVINAVLVEIDAETKEAHNIQHTQSIVEPKNI